MLTEHLLSNINAAHGFSVKHFGGKNCSETRSTCSKCPKSTTCLEFEDQDGYFKSACLCRANETLVGDTCKSKSPDFILFRYFCFFCSHYKYLFLIIPFVVLFPVCLVSRVMHPFLAFKHFEYMVLAWNFYTPLCGWWGQYHASITDIPEPFLAFNLDWVDLGSLVKCAVMKRHPWASGWQACLLATTQSWLPLCLYHTLVDVLCPYGPKYNTSDTGLWIFRG